MKTLTFPLLTANDIDLRVGSTKKDNGTVVGFQLLLYKDARVDMKVLDEVVGCFNWKREHQELKGNIYCGVSIWDDEKAQWITKWDAGSESNTEKEKGEASDSFKRACVNIGIGRELYTAPFVWIDCKKTGYDSYTRFEVKEIGYNDNREINHLVIIESRSKQVAFTTGKKAVENKAPKLSLETFNWCKKLEIDLYKLAAYKQKEYCDLTEDDCAEFIEKRKASRGFKDED